MKLTAETVKARLETPAKDRAIHWDDDLPGFGLREQSGKRTWIVRFRVAGSGAQRQKTLGDRNRVSLAAARKLARGYLDQARAGEDRIGQNREQRRSARARKAAVDTRGLGTIIRGYLAEAEKTLRPKTLAEVRRYLEKSWEPLHSTLVDDLPPEQIRERLREIRNTAGPIASNRAKTALGAALAWATVEGIIARNPVVGIPSLGKEVRRDRVLDEAELRRVWHALPVGDYGDIVRLLMLTGQRRDEVAGIRWSELDLDKGLWSMPGSRTKNGRPHLVPLSEPVLTIVAGLERRPGRDLLFGRGASPFSGWSQCKARLVQRLAERHAAEAGRNKAEEDDHLPPWVIHDIRRSVVTHMAEMGIAPHVIEAIVNHVSGHKAGVAGVYNKAVYLPERKAALAAMGAALGGHRRGLGGASNVVPLDRLNTARAGWAEPDGTRQTERPGTAASSPGPRR